MPDTRTSRGIPFRTIMAQAVVDGIKTETRRLIKPQPFDPGSIGISPIWGFGVPTGHENPKLRDKFCVHAAFNAGGQREDRWVPCRYGKPGDGLYVREPVWVPPPITQKMLRDGADTWPDFIYGDGEPGTDHSAESLHEQGWKHRPAFLMPREACRADDLLITAMRAEPLWDITEEGAIAEGAARMPGFDAHVKAGVKNPHRNTFLKFFGLMHRVQISTIYPVVWVIQFKREAAHA